MKITYSYEFADFLAQIYIRNLKQKGSTLHAIFSFSIFIVTVHHYCSPLLVYKKRPISLSVFGCVSWETSWGPLTSSLSQGLELSTIFRSAFTNWCFGLCSPFQLLAVSLLLWKMQRPLGRWNLVMRSTLLLDITAKMVSSNVIFQPSGVKEMEDGICLKLLAWIVSSLKANQNQKQQANLRSISNKRII